MAATIVHRLYRASRRSILSVTRWAPSGASGAPWPRAGVDAVLGGLSQWVASGAEWLLSQIGNVLTSTTTIDLGASWFRTHYEVMTALAGVVVLPLLLVSTLQAVLPAERGAADPGVLRAASPWPSSSGWSPSRS